MRFRRIAIAVSALTLTGLLGAVPTASAEPYCGITWGSLPKAVTQGTTAPIVNVRTGRHDCWDRLVLDLTGMPAPGYDVRYVDSYRFLASGDVIPVSGGAILTVRAFAPAMVSWRTPNVVTPSEFSAAGYRTFRDLVYGGSDGRNTEFALGVRARLPFRVFTLTGPDNTSRLVVDVAHQW